jgi:hypothetical protein
VVQLLPNTLLLHNWPWQSSAPCERYLTSTGLSGRRLVQATSGSEIKSPSKVCLAVCQLAHCTSNAHSPTFPSHRHPHLLHLPATLSVSAPSRDPRTLQHREEHGTSASATVHSMWLPVRHLSAGTQPSRCFMRCKQRSCLPTQLCFRPLAVQRSNLSPRAACLQYP